ncbi:MAG TPA: hypothetical protein VLY45_03160 [Nitrospiria bacterium]|nr:hypothetical protein [Nitrospiria bacterium]
MLVRRFSPRRLVALHLMAAVAILIGLGLPAREGMTGVLPQRAPTAPPKRYFPINPCQSQLGQVWAPPSASEAPTGNVPPLLGFYQGQLTGMVYYLSEKHLYQLLPNRGQWGFTGVVNSTVDSITLSPAQLRPNRDKRAYEMTIMVHHDQPVTVTCAAPTAPALNQGQGQSGGGSAGQSGGSAGGGFKKPK